MNNTKKIIKDLKELNHKLKHQSELQTIRYFGEINKKDRKLKNIKKYCLDNLKKEESLYRKTGIFTVDGEEMEFLGDYNVIKTFKAILKIIEGEEYEKEKK